MKTKWSWSHLKSPCSLTRFSLVLIILPFDLIFWDMHMAVLHISVYLIFYIMSVISMFSSSCTVSNFSSSYCIFSKFYIQNSNSLISFRVFIFSFISRLFIFTLFTFPYYKISMFIDPLFSQVPIFTAFDLPLG